MGGQDTKNKSPSHVVSCYLEEGGVDVGRERPREQGLPRPGRAVQQNPLHKNRIKKQARRFGFEPFSQQASDGRAGGWVGEWVHEQREGQRVRSSSYMVS